MALKQQYTMSAGFSMASMTDIIFLLLIFFMVTSTYVFPTALEIDLPQSSRQTALKPSTRVFVHEDGRMEAQTDDEDPVEVTLETLPAFVDASLARLPEGEPFSVAVFADENVTYGNIVKVLDLGATRGIKFVLATKAVASPAQDAAGDDAPQAVQPQ